MCLDLYVSVVVAEWLRRWTRNPLGSPRAGSNPADYDNLFPSYCHLFTFFEKEKIFFDSTFSFTHARSKFSIARASWIVISTCNPSARKP